MKRVSILRLLTLFIINVEQNHHLTVLGLQGEGLLHGHRVVCTMDYDIIYNDILNLEDIEPALGMCTHLMFRYAGLDPKTYQIVSNNPFREIDLRGYDKSATLFKKMYPNLIVMIAVGGYNVKSGTFSEMCEQLSTRWIFITSAVKFLQQHSFDGLQLNWFYPGIEGGTKYDKGNLVLLSKELKDEFDKHNLIYSIAVNGRITEMNAGIDGKSLSKYVSFLSVISSGLYKYWEGSVAPDSLLFPLSSDDELSIDSGIQNLLRMGTDPRRVSLHIFNNFDSFSLSTPLNSQGVAAIVGLPIQNLQSVTYYEVCGKLENENWAVVNDSETGMRFAINDDTAVSLENSETLEKKVKYVFDNKLGGIIYDSLGRDDAKGSCRLSDGPFPLLRLISESLNNYSLLSIEEIRNSMKGFSAEHFWNG